MKKKKKKKERNDYQIYSILYKKENNRQKDLV